VRNVRGALGTGCCSRWRLQAFHGCEVDVDVRVLAAGLGVTLAAALFFGLVPALQAMAAKPDQTLKDMSRGGTASPVKRQMSHAFVVAETALAVVLLVGAGLLVRSFIRLTNQSLGFRPDQAVVFRLTLPESRYPTIAGVSQFHRDVLDRIRQLPAFKLLARRTRFRSRA
jgi:hypothetical protein